MKSRRLFPALALTLFFTLPGLSAEPRAVSLSATDSLVRYEGRFDHGDPSGPRCAWSASAVHLHFKGTALSVRMAGKGQDFWDVLVDGQPFGILERKDDQTIYQAAAQLPDGEHTADLVKRTEFNVGMTQFLGFEVNPGGRFLPAPAAPARRIEVIGDSISCGYGNEAPTKEEKFTPLRENARIAYGALAARELGADYLCVAWSGKKLWPNNSILDYYDRILPNHGGAPWNFTGYIPDVVVINLGSNDFGMTNPDGDGWTEAYRQLLHRLRGQYPDAWIYCTLGTMLGDWPADRKPASTIRGYLTKLTSEFHAKGDTKVRFLDFGTQKPENGFGGSWHPSARTHQLMAAQLTSAIKNDLGW